MDRRSDVRVSVLMTERVEGRMAGWLGGSGPTDECVGAHAVRECQRTLQLALRYRACLADHRHALGVGRARARALRARTAVPRVHHVAPLGATLRAAPCAAR